MLAYGKLNRDMMSNGYVGCELGFEFSGLLKNWRIKGVAKQASAIHVFARDYLVRASCLALIPQNRQLPFQDAQECALPQACP